MKSRHARTIGPFRRSGLNDRPTPKQSAPAAPQQPSAARTAPIRPSDARTLGEAADGMLRAAGRLHFVTPRFPDTRGSWIRVGAHQCRVPVNSITAFRRADNGREFALVAGTLNHDGKFWILMDTADGVREVLNLPDGYRADLRRAVFFEAKS